MKRLATALTCLLLLPALHADDQQVTLENGLRILAVQRPQADVAAWTLTFRYPALGPQDEPPGVRGVAQQMLLDFLRARLANDPSAVAMRIERDAGAPLGLGTEWEYVEVRGKTASADLGACLSLVASTVFQAKPAAEALDAARKTLSAAESQDIGGVAEGTFYLFRQALEGPDAPTGPVYASAKAMAAITLADVMTALARYYTTGNALLTVVAPQPPAQAIEIAKAVLGTLPKAAAPSLPALPPRPETSDIRVGDVNGSDRASLIVGVGLPPFSSPDFAIGRVIAEALSGKGGRIERDRTLFQTFGLAVPSKLMPGGAAQMLDVPLAERPYLAIHAFVSPTSMDDAAQALERLLLSFADDPMPEPELKRAKARVIGEHAIERDRALPLADRLGVCRFYGLDPAKDANLAETVNAVTAQQVLDFARKYFTRVAIGVRVPS